MALPSSRSQVLTRCDRGINRWRIRCVACSISLGSDALGMRLCVAVSGLKIQSQGHPQIRLAKRLLAAAKWALMRWLSFESMPK